MRSEKLIAVCYRSWFATHQSTKHSWIWWLVDVSGCLTLLLLKCPCSQTCQLRSAKWCYVSYFQRLEICMQIRSVNFRKLTWTWFATRVFIFRPPETLLCVLVLKLGNFLGFRQKFWVMGNRWISEGKFWVFLVIFRIILGNFAFSKKHWDFWKIFRNFLHFWIFFHFL